MGGKEVEIGTSEYPTNPLEDPQKKGPFRRKKLVGTTELVRQNILLPRNILGHQGDRMALSPKHYLGSQATYDTKHCATLISEVSNNRGVVPHQDDTLT